MGTPQATTIGPGLGAFVAFFALAVALWFLMRNMNARMRRMAYRERDRIAAIEAELAAEEAGKAPATLADTGLAPPHLGGPPIAPASAPSIYPYLVTEAYPAPDDPQLRRPLGHGLSIQLVLDEDGLLRPCGAQELQRRGIRPDAAYAQAQANLHRLMQQGVLDTRIHTSPQGRRYALVEGHWAAAGAILLPELRATLTADFGTDLVAAVPHREALVVGPAGDPDELAPLSALVAQLHADGTKPLSTGLFRLTAQGPVEFSP